jgi:hypothetical protein
VASDTNLGPANLPVTEYRLYVLNERGRVSSPAQIIEAVNDEGAIEIATRMQNGCVIEIWDEARLVIRLEPDSLSRPFGR